MKVFVRHGDTASIYDGFPAAPAVSESFKALPGNKVEVAPDGKTFAVLTIQSITIYDCATEQQVGGLPLSGCIAIAFSPSGALMQTFEKPDKEKGNAHKNLKLWDLATGEVLLQLFQKSFSKDSWPAIQLTAEEDLAFVAGPNAVNVYNPRDFPAGIQKKLHIKGLGGFAVAPAGAPHLAIYVPELKGSPGFVAIYDHTQLGKGGEAPTAICRRSFFRASEVKLTWGAAGGGLLVETSSDTDATNKSYYGETKLHFLSAARGVSDCLVALKEGPVHCATWAPDGSAFAVVAGFMPAQTVIFDAKCKQVADLGAGAHNLVRFNRWARFLAVAGFGNLPGDLVLFEKNSDSQWKQLAATRVNNGVTMEWGPDGRHLLTATLTPRLRIDNAMYCYRHDGTLVAQQPFTELLEAIWLPAGQEAFEDRPSSPRASAKAAAAQAAASGMVLKQPPPKASGYVPPGRRTAGGTSAGEPDFSAAYERHARVGKASAAAAAGKTLIPGSSGTAGALSKSAARRAKKKANAEASGGGGGEEADADASAEAVTSGVVALTMNDTAAPSAKSEQAAAAGGASAAADAAKRIRNLQKKLRQVQELKEKPAGSLDAGQQAKVASEASLIAEISSLGGTA